MASFTFMPVIPNLDLVPNLTTVLPYPEIL